ncbi:neurofilament light polypeptide-like [Metopolophium dirhodum]|uniref:neurofilament light polypeptide-like n=1 Tax=Metopolophium dirhodum TaxID=44670 RepID=UPI002990732B|nr:neurofilament light polypeptide-like [Metopolophium dirhodum]
MSSTLFKSYAIIIVLCIGMTLFHNSSQLTEAEEKKLAEEKKAEEARQKEAQKEEARKNDAQEEEARKNDAQEEEASQKEAQQAINENNSGPSGPYRAKVSYKIC